MKKYLLWSVLVFIVAIVQTNVYAQESTQGIHYQAVARNSFNQPLVNMPVVLKISITGDDAAQQVFYTEQQEVTTNEHNAYTQRRSSSRICSYFLDNLFDLQGNRRVLCYLSESRQPPAN